MKILVVEDERKTASFLRRGLEENGFVVDLAEDGEEGLYLALHGHYDLLVLDVMLPKQDGYSIVEELRLKQKNTLALFLTARDEIADRVRGLNSGADAYLGKPFAFSEFMAHVRSLLRRGAFRTPDVLRVADLEVNLRQLRAFRKGVKLELRPKEFQLIALFARRAGEVLSRATIAEQVWNMNFDSDTNVVDVHVLRLRAQVDVPFDKKLIHTVRGMGYVLRENEG